MRMLVVGDSHGNVEWWDHVVAPAVDALAVDEVLQVGDFGYWGGVDAQAFITKAAQTQVPVRFCDGNHEDHPLLAADVDAAVADGRGIPGGPVNLCGQLWYLPRGSVFDFAGLRFVVCGGAVSIDRGWRTAGVDYFIEEQVSDADLAAVAAAGRGDVFVCHDAPAGWQIPGLLPDHRIAQEWQRQRPACDEHRARLREAYESVQPRLVLHGHYHRRYRHLAVEQWGTVQIEGLNCDTEPGALGLLEVRDGHVAFSEITIG